MMGKRIGYLLCVVLCVFGCGCSGKTGFTTGPATDAAVMVVTGSVVSGTGLSVLPAVKAEGRATGFRNSASPSGATWARDLVADDRYIFYADESHIIRLDRTAKEKKVIARHRKGGNISMCLDGKFLYYVDDDDTVYKVSINGGKKEKIITRRILEQEGYKIPYILAVRIYKGVMYIHTKYCRDIIRYFPERKKIEKIGSAIYQSAFYKGSLYYTDRGERCIYRINLKTLKKEIVRKDPDKKEKGLIYRDLLCAGGKLYYLRGDKMQIFCYSEEGKDEPVGEEMTCCNLIAGADDKLYYRCYPENWDYRYGPEYLGVHDGYSNTILLLMPDDVLTPAFVVGNVLYYEAEFTDENGVRVDMDYYYYKECSWEQ